MAFSLSPPNALRSKAGAVETSSPKSMASLQAFAGCGLEVVHLLAASLRVERSLPAAVRYAGRHASQGAAEEFRRMEWEVRLRHYATIDEAFVALARRVGTLDSELKRALLTLQRAESEPTREGLERRLDRAYDIMAIAETRRRELLQSTLDRPVSILFGAGVVLPLLLAALAPMMQFSGTGLGTPALAAILLVAVPVSTYLGAERIIERHRLGRPVSRPDAKLLIAAGCAPLAAAAVGWVASGLLRATPSTGAILMIAGPAVCASVLAGIYLFRRFRSIEHDLTTVEAELADVLHAVGSHMSAGRPAEQALLETVNAAGPGVLTTKLRMVLFDVLVGRRSLEDAVERDDDVAGSARAVAALRLLASAARRNHLEAGRIVTHLAEFERVRQDAQAATRLRIRSVVDTARTSVVVFAPMILGITAGMYGIFARLGGGLVAGHPSGSGAGAQSFASLMVLYLCVEVVMVSWFAARMGSVRPLTDFAKSLARDVPLALGLFAAALLAGATLF